MTHQKDNSNDPRGQLHILAFCDQHVEDAARLFCSRYESQRRLVPSLPEKHQNPELLTPRLQELSAQNRGVVAIQGGRLVGFILAQVLPSFRGHRTAYSPEWANAAGSNQQRDVHREMYARVSAEWVADGCVTHLLTTFASEKHVLDSYFWSGFGLVATDAIRDVSPVPCDTASLEVRLAEREDARDVKQLADELQAYMTRPPVLMRHSSTPSSGEVTSQINDAQHPTWLAYRNGTAVASLGLRPASASACHVIHDVGTVSISRAFAQEDVRGSGIGITLLAHSMDWARSNGFTRCAVDFEPENVQGSRFWLGHFDAICQTAIRHIDVPTQPEAPISSG